MAGHTASDLVCYTPPQHDSEKHTDYQSLSHLQPSAYRFCDTYAEYSCYRKGHVNPGNNLQINEKFLSNTFNSKTIRKDAKYTSMLHPFQATVVHKLYDTDHEARLNSVNWCCLMCMMKKQTLYSFCLRVKIGLNSEDTCILRIMSFPQ